MAKNNSQTSTKTASTQDSGNRAESPSETAPASSGQSARVTYSAHFGVDPVYADGVHSLTLRGGVVLIDLYQIVLPAIEQRNQPEQRLVTHRLALPLAAMAELDRILNTLRQGPAGREQQNQPASGGSAG